jgi:hypothetical protein
MRGYKRKEKTPIFQCVGILYQFAFSTGPVLCLLLYVWSNKRQMTFPWGQQEPSQKYMLNFTKSVERA